MSFNNFEQIERVNFTEMTDVSLAKWLRELSAKSGKGYVLNLQQALSMVKALRVVYKLGEIRGASVSKSVRKNAV